MALGYGLFHRVGRRSSSDEKRLRQFTLGPRNDCAPSDSDEILDRALADPGITNIAVAGAYGSGKSSFLNSYFQRRRTLRRRLKVLRISLLGFCGGGIADTSSLERMVLQQIFLTERKDSLPGSRMDRLQPLQLGPSFAICLYAFLVGLLAVFVFCRQTVLSLPGALDFYVANRTLVICLFAYLVCVLSIAPILWLYRCWENGLVRTRIKSSLAEIEISESHPVSVINYMLDELVYFFAVTKYDCVVFEDIDRFDCEEIFVKLKEACSAINNSPLVKRKLTFVFAVRDDLFADPERRTKFFDCIIPIVPVADRFNARAILSERFSAVDRGNRKLMIAVNELARFVPDMRVLNCISNEFELGVRRLGVKAVGRERFFALVVMKNLMPREYELLRMGEGAFRRLLAARDEIVGSIVRPIKKRLDQDEEAYRTWKSQTDPVLNKLYLSAKDLAAWRSEDYSKLTAIAEQRSRLEQENSTPLIALVHRGLITEQTIAEALDGTETRRWEVELFYRLVERGYLNECYSQLISPFREGYLSSGDYEFEQRVISYQEPIYKYSLDKPGVVADDLMARYFSHPAALNFSLVGYLLDNDKDYREKLTLVLRQLEISGVNGLDFIDQYIRFEQVGRRKNKLFLYVFRLWPSYFERLLEISKYSPKKIAYQLGAALGTACHIPQDAKLPRCVWRYLDEINDSRTFCRDMACSLVSLKRAIARFHFEFSNCSDDNLKDAGIYDEVMKARTVMAQKRKGYARSGNWRNI